MPIPVQNRHSIWLAGYRRACYSWRRRPRLYVVGRFFVAEADRCLGEVGPLRETRMACPPTSTDVEPQPKSRDPAGADGGLSRAEPYLKLQRQPANSLTDAWRARMKRSTYSGSLGRQLAAGAGTFLGFDACGTGALAVAPRPDDPALPERTAIQLLDNRRFVQRHQAGPTEWPASAPSHDARCAAAGRRSGGLDSKFWGTPTDS